MMAGRSRTSRRMESSLWVIWLERMAMQLFRRLCDRVGKIEGDAVMLPFRPLHIIF